MHAIETTADSPLRLVERPLPEPGPGQVRIAIRAAGLNRGDLLQRRGLYPPPKGASDVMGLECAGVIDALGEGVDRWTTGARVAALLPGGGYATHTLADEGCLLPIPDGLSFTEAACLPEAMMTVWANVFLRCDLKQGEAFLCQGGTSGIGVMAIQMARLAGADPVFATAGSDAKCALMRELGATHAINYRLGSFAEIVRAEGGADVILDMVGGDYVAQHIEVAKPDGRICNIAYQAGSKVTIDLMRLMLKRLVLTGTTLRARTPAEKRRIRDAIERDFWPAVADGRLRTVIDSTFPLDNAEAAQARMSAGGHSGKIILTVEPG